MDLTNGRKMELFAKNGIILSFLAHVSVLREYFDCHDIAIDVWIGNLQKAIPYDQPQRVQLDGVA